MQIAIASVVRVSRARERATRVHTRRLSAEHWRAAPQLPATAANGGWSRDHPAHPSPARARTSLFTNNNNRAGGASTAAAERPATRATSYAQLSLHLAGFDSEPNVCAWICLLRSFRVHYRSPSSVSRSRVFRS